MVRERFVTLCVTLVVATSGVEAAELSVDDLAMPPAGTATVVVSGSIAGESTFGVNILLESVPRAGNTKR